MLLPDNMQPELCIYYNGAMILKELKETERLKAQSWHDRTRKKREREKEREREREREREGQNVLKDGSAVKS